MIERLAPVINHIAPAVLRRRTLSAALVASLLVALYWSLIASDRYVSEGRAIVQRTELAGGQNVDFASLLGSSDGGSRADQLLLRDHLLSIDMLKKLDAKLDLREHYSYGWRDLGSRMWFKDAALERFHRHYLSRVSVEFDEHSGILVMRAQAYDPKTAHAIASMMVEEGERFMNEIAHRLAQEQVVFLEKQVAQMGERLLRARQTVLKFQNEKGLVFPQGTAESLAAVINRLEAQVTDLQMRRAAMLGYLKSDSPGIVQINQEIAAVRDQIASEKTRLASPNATTLNLIVEEFQRLQMSAEFAAEAYKTALAALEKGRFEASRTLKKVSVVQSPFEPEYPLEPRRLYNTVVFILIALLIAGIVDLLAAIVRDHQD